MPRGRGKHSALQVLASLIGRLITIAVIIALGLSGAAVITNHAGVQADQDESIISRVLFANESHGWILETTPAFGFIFGTTDGGASWRQLYRSKRTFCDLKFIDPSIGWVVGSRGTILRTSDGGKTWERQESGTSDVLFALAVIDRNTAWACGANGLLLYTNDGGKHWKPRVLKSGIANQDVAFRDELHGWVVGWNTIWSTTDGGETWKPWRAGAWDRLTSVHFVDAACGWVSDGPEILRTTDGGGTWTEINIPSQGRVSGLSFVDPMHGLIAKSRGAEGSVVHVPGNDFQSSESFVLYTEDGGTTWSQSFHIESLKDHSAWIIDMFFLNRSVGWAVGREGLILRTSDGGKNWSREPRPVLIESAGTKEQKN